MKPKKPEKQILESSFELWRAINEQAGLDLESYDSDVVEELCTRLGLSVSDVGQINAWESVTVEQLLINLIQLVSPYGQMVNEILSFYAMAGARSSGDNLRFRFDFDSVADNFEFELRQFRDFQKTLEETVQSISTYEVDSWQAMRLRHAVTVGDASYKVDNGRFKWPQAESPEIRIGVRTKGYCRFRTAASNG
ncbi:MAG: hypothetical protein IPK58_24305 [Acidobacteria bacterium]|nr:hypothetical protein [Acidobacteriota bacterium]